MKNKKGDEKFIAFYDENNELIEGFFIIIEETPTYVKIKTSKNILTLPWSRVLKIKEQIN